MATGLALGVGLTTALPGSAVGVPVPARPAHLPAGVEVLQPYVGQEGCDPVAKPGVLAFQQLLMSTYRDTGSLGIVRDCGIGGSSEHKEGRAFDWAVSAYNANHVAEVKALMDWLTATSGGEFASNARRFGIMYMIWNRQIWKAYRPEAGWQPYTGASPHTDHVHFSFGWNGARKATSWWSGRVAPLDYGPYSSQQPPPPSEPSGPTPGMPIPSEIDAKHVALGGDASVLGAPTGPETDLVGGRHRGYQRGAIYWTAATGAHEVHGDVWRRYLTTGGYRSPLGYPTSDELAVTDGRANTFQGGAVLWSPTSGAQAVYGDIWDRYWLLGASRSVLGLPTTSETAVPGGRQVAFQRGVVVWSPATGAKALHGAIEDLYTSMGGAAGPLGLPLAEEADVPGGRAAVFQGGRIIWSPTLGARAVTGDIADRYVALGASGGPLGLPLTGESEVPGGRQALFQGGRIVASRTTGTRAVAGEIERRYAQLGGPTGPLGLPTGEEVQAGAGRSVSFQHGRITWSPATGAQDVRGAIAEKYLALGGEPGMLGLPVSTELPAGPAARVNRFQEGDVYWSAATGAAEVHGAIRGTWLALGGHASWLGLPVGDERPEPGGVSSSFVGGRVYWAPAVGTRTLRGSIGQRYLADGGAARYGMPTSEEYAVAGGRAQDFGRAVLTWNATTGAVAVRSW